MTSHKRHVAGLALVRIVNPGSAAVACGALLCALIGMSGCEKALDSRVEPSPVGGPTVMRRLTESQYRATVADIFGPEIPVAARFERGLRSEGLLAIGTGESGMSPFSIEQYDAAALGIATTVVSEQWRGELVPCVPRSETVFDQSCATRFVEHYGPLLFVDPWPPTRLPDSLTRPARAACSWEMSTRD